MAKYCPVTESIILYLECQECDNKVCRNGKDTVQKNIRKEINHDEEKQK